MQLQPRFAPTFSLGALKLQRLAVALVATAAVFGVMSTPSYAAGASQLIFLDDVGSVYSIYISGPNQNGVQTNVCWGTPGYRTATTGWWWKNRTNVTPYYTSNCTGSVVNNMHLWIAPDGGSAWRCLRDTSPYPDWNC